MTDLKNILAESCEHCPLCRYARKHPENWFGKVMQWHGTWCPMWKAWEREHGDKKGEASKD